MCQKIIDLEKIDLDSLWKKDVIVMKLKSEQSEENGRKDETELNQDDLTQIPQWMLDIQVLLTRSFLTNTREIYQRLWAMRQKEHPPKVRTITNRAYSVRLIVVAVFVVLLALWVSGASNIAIGILFPQYYFFHVWIKSGYGYAMYLYNICYNIGFSTLIMLMVNRVILCDIAPKIRYQKAILWLINLGVTNVIGTWCGMGMMLLSKYVNAYGALTLFLGLLLAAAIAAPLLIFCYRELYQSVFMVLLGCIVCPRFIQLWTFVFPTDKIWYIVPELMILMALLYVLTFLAEKIKLIHFFEMVLDFATSFRGLAILVILYQLKDVTSLFKAGRIVPGFVVLAIGFGLITLIYVLTTYTNKLKIFNKKTGMIIIAALGELSTVFYIIDFIKKGGIYIGFAILAGAIGAGIIYILYSWWDDMWKS